MVKQKGRSVTPERLASIERNFHDYGVRILLFARLTPGIRAPIFVTAGVIRLPLLTFVVADGIYAVPGVSLLFFLGYWVGESACQLSARSGCGFRFSSMRSSEL